MHRTKIITIKKKSKVSLPPLQEIEFNLINNKSTRANSKIFKIELVTTKKKNRSVAYRICKVNETKTATWKLNYANSHIQNQKKKLSKRDLNMQATQISQLNEKFMS